MTSNILVTYLYLPSGVFHLFGHHVWPRGVCSMCDVQNQDSKQTKWMESPGKMYCILRSI